MSLPITWNMPYSYLFGRFTKPLRIKLHNSAQRAHRCLFLRSGLISISSAFILGMWASFNISVSMLLLKNNFSREIFVCRGQLKARANQWCVLQRVVQCFTSYVRAGVSLECCSVCSLGATKRMGCDPCARHDQSRAHGQKPSGAKSDKWPRENGCILPGLIM